jgi:hypothetical protein
VSAAAEGVPLQPGGPKPRTRLLAIDHGQARFGLAVSDAERRIASPRP